MDSYIGNFFETPFQNLTYVPLFQHFLPKYSAFFLGNLPVLMWVVFPKFLGSPLPLTSGSADTGGDLPYTMWGIFHFFSIFSSKIRIIFGQDAFLIGLQSANIHLMGESRKYERRNKITSQNNIRTISPSLWDSAIISTHGQRFLFVITTLFSYMSLGKVAEEKNL